jgi:hypothetical protein
VLDELSLRVKRGAFLVPLLANACTGQIQIGTTQGTVDAGVDAAHKSDASDHDTGIAKRDAPVSEDASSGGATLLQSGAALILFGVTSDGYAVYAVDTSTPTLLAAPLGGGAPITIGTVASESCYLVIQGATVLIYDSITSTGGATLETWTSAGKLETISPSAFEYSATLSPDGKTLSYFDNFNPNESTADAYVVETGGSGKMLLHPQVPGVGVSPSCRAELGFAGAAIGLTYCSSTTPSLAGSVYTYTAPSYSEVDAVDGIYPYFVPNPVGTILLVESGTSGLELVPVAGGSATVVDPIGQVGIFTSDGSTLVYTTTTGELRSSPVATPSPTTLVSNAPILGMVDLSPDGKEALVYEQYNSSNYNHDLYAASASTPGSLLTLNAAETSSQLFGDTFTADSSSALFWSGVGGAYLGTLESSFGSGTPATLATASNTAWAATGSTVVFAANESTPPGSSIANVDIERMVLGTKPSSSAVLAKSVNGSSGTYAPFFLNPARDAVVFTANAGNGLAGGLYVKSLSP